jgi:choline dehydrogenase-like flavoprotein
VSKSGTDVFVVGSGASGTAVAYALCAQGLRVLVLEAGPVYSPIDDYLLHTLHWAAAHFPHKVAIRGRQTFAPLQALDERWNTVRYWNPHTGRTIQGRSAPREVTTTWWASAAAPWASLAKHTGCTRRPCACTSVSASLRTGRSTTRYLSPTTFKPNASSVLPVRALA